MRNSIYAATVYICICMSGCSIFSPSEYCHERFDDLTACRQYSSSNFISFCHEDGITSLPNCHVEEQCTDYLDGGAETDTDTLESTAEGDTSSSNSVCKKVCVGELLPCEPMSESQCLDAYHCTWVVDDNL